MPPADGAGAAGAAGPADSSPGKRKAIDGEGVFVKGAIVRVKLRNIQVCSDIEVFPGPGLNLIVGPNGAGKSTIVAGIFLCLGGDHKLLRRHERIGEYVKSKPQKEDEGFIEVELCGGEGEANIVVSRRIRAGGPDKKEYHIDGKPAKESDVHKLAKSLNIHMENLCQFLPQDRVSEFADMTPQQILKATEEAIGGQELVSLHDQIIKLGAQERDFALKVEDISEQVDKYQKQLDSMKAAYERFKGWEQAKQMLTLLEKKLAWAKYNKVYEEVNKQKEVEKEKKEQVNAMKKNLEPERKLLEELERKSKALAKEADDARASMNAVFKKSDALQKKFETASENFEAASEDRGNSASLAEKLERKMAKNDDAIAELEERIANTQAKDVTDELAAAKKDVHEYTDRVRLAERKETKLKVGIDDMLRQVRDKAAQQKKLEDGSKVLERLLQDGKHVWAAVTWLRENRDKFKMDVFEPMVLHLRVPDRENAKYVEASVPKRDLYSFVTLCKEDNDRFFKAMYDQKLKVNIVQAPPDMAPSRIKNVDGLKAKFGGGVQLLSDVVEAPEPIMRYLNKFNKLNSIMLIPGKDAGKQSEALFEEHGVERFFSEGMMCNTRRSKYGQRSISSSFNRVRPAKFLTQSVDQSALQQVKREISALQKAHEKSKTDLQSVKHEVSEARADLSGARNAAEDIKKQHNELSNLQKQVKRLQEKSGHLQSQARDARAKSKKSADRVKQVAEKMVVLALQRKQFSKDVADLAKNAYEVGLRHAQAEREKKGLDDSLKEKTAEFRAFETAYEDAKALRKVLVAQAKKLLEEAQRLIGGNKEPGEVKGLMDAFNLYPDEAHELEAMIAEEKAKLDCTADPDSDIVKSYQEVEKKLNALRPTLNKCAQEHDDVVAELEKRKEVWVPQVKKITKEVTDKFADMFASIGHVGEVLLHEDEFDYSQYGLLIRMSFKSDGKLHQLKGSFQSGGEKMVSTMLFLLALQKLSSCPFRLVDEINQGMDQRNERRVFKQVVQCSEDGGQSQYFMVSPKLLPDLEYSDSMKVIVVFSGPWLHAKEWKVNTERSMINRAIAKKRRLSVA